MLRRSFSKILFAALAALILAARPADATERRFVLFETGLGPMTLGEPIDVPTLQAAYPEFRFRRADAETTAILATENGAAALQIKLEEGRVTSIITDSPRIVTQQAARIGLRFADLPDAAAETCYPWRTEDDPDARAWVACRATDVAGLRYLFRRGEHALDGASRLARLVLK